MWKWYWWYKNTWSRQDFSYKNCELLSKVSKWIKKKLLLQKVKSFSTIYQIIFFQTCLDHLLWFQFIKNAHLVWTSKKFSNLIFFFATQALPLNFEFHLSIFMRPKVSNLVRLIGILFAILTFWNFQKWHIL